MTALLHDRGDRCPHVGSVVRVQSLARSNVNGHALKVQGWATEVGFVRGHPAMTAYAVRMDRAGISEDHRRPIAGHLLGDRGHVGLGYVIDEQEVGGVVDVWR